MPWVNQFSTSMPRFNIPDGRALSLGGLIYGLRILNTSLTPQLNTIRNNIKKNKYNRNPLSFLRSHIRLFNYYKHDDWQYIFIIDDNNKAVIKNKFYVNSLIDIFSATYRNSDAGFDNVKLSYNDRNIKYDVKQHTDKFNDVLENYLKLKYSEEYLERSPSSYDSIVLDTNEIYTLRLIRINKNVETPMHNHRGLCLYRMINHWANSDAKSVLRNIKYVNVDDVCDYGATDTITTSIITNDYLNILHTNEFHQLKALNTDCYSLHLYFHDFDIYRC